MPSTSSNPPRSPELDIQPQLPLTVSAPGGRCPFSRITCEFEERTQDAQIECVKEHKNWLYYKGLRQKLTYEERLTAVCTGNPTNGSSCSAPTVTTTVSMDSNSMDLETADLALDEMRAMASFHELCYKDLGESSGKGPTRKKN